VKRLERGPAEPLEARDEDDGGGVAEELNGDRAGLVTDKSDAVAEPEFDRLSGHAVSPGLERSGENEADLRMAISD
jgi:hypothetical protein